MLAREAVETVRSMLTGSQMDEVSVLGVPYNPTTDSTITLRYPKRNVGAGQVASVGLNTFILLSVSTDGVTFDVLPSMDGGPHVAAPEGEIVRFRPAFTTWAIFRELQGEINSMSSPDTGLYWPWVYVPDTINRTSGTYPLPTEADVALPFRLVQAEYQVAGTTISQAFTDCAYQPNENQVRVFSDPPNAVGYTFTMALPFGQMTDLDSDLSAIGLNGGSITDIPILGAASTMVLGWEGRRTQPIAQGDTRRAGEVSVNSNASLSRQWKARQQETILQEQARLVALYGYRQPQTYGYTQGGGWR